MQRRRNTNEFRPDPVEAFERRVLLSTYYVSPDGNDAAPGTSTSGSWRTLQNAADHARAGDTIRVAAGTYTAGMNLFGKAGGTQDAPIQFLADPGAVITHAATTGINADVAAINIESTDGWYVVRGFTVRSDGSMTKAGIRVAHSSNCQILDNVIDGAFTGIFVSNATGTLIQGNTCGNSTDQHGIYVSLNTTGTVVRGNTLFGNRWDGLHMNALNGAPNDGALVENNVIYGNNLSGMDIEGVTDATFRNNLVYANYKHGLTLHNLDQSDTPPCTGNLIVNNTVADNGMFAIQMQAGGNWRNTIFNNILTSTNFLYGAIGVGTGGAAPAGLNSDYNLVVDNFSTDPSVNTMSLASWQILSGQDTHSLIGQGDQLFIDSAAHNYHLRPAGLATDAGTDAFNARHAPFFDFDGVIRSQGARWDAGAFEDASVPDTVPPVIGGVSGSGLRPTRITIAWNTTELADAQVEFGPDSLYGNLTPFDVALRADHSITLTGLIPNTEYHYRVRSRDAFGNLALSGDFVFVTPPPDVTPPVASAILAAPWVDGAVLSWTTDEEADTQIQFGLTPDYGTSTPVDPALRLVHAVTLGNLAPATTYHFRVASRDEYGNLTLSEDQTFTTAAPGQLPTSPIAYWNFDGSDGTIVPDLSGNGSTGTLLGGATLAPGRDPASGAALNFDGVDDRVRVPRSPILEPDKVTLSAWVKLAVGATQAQWVTIVKKTYADDTPPIYDSYSLSIAPPGRPNVLSFFTGHAGGVNDELDSPTALPTGRWIHVAGTYDPATGVKRLYLDGELIASRPLTRPLIYDANPSGDLYLAQDPGPAEAFRGQIDDVAIWARALSPTEIRTLAYGRPASLPAPTDLVATVLFYTRVRLTWADHTGGAAGFLLQRSLDGSSWSDVASTAPGVTTFEDSTVPTSKVVQYRVLAYNALSASEPSDPTFASTKAGGTGLVGTYSATADLATPAVTRNDPTVNFDWDRNAPAPGIPAGAFAATWAGQVLPFESGAYTFSTTADDGVRLWVNGQLVIDHWTDAPRLDGDTNLDGTVDGTDFQVLYANLNKPGGWAQGDFNGDGLVTFADFQRLERNYRHSTTPTTSTGTITLQAGIKYDIRLEYYQAGGLASVKLRWTTPGQTTQVIPEDQLFPPAPPAISAPETRVPVAIPKTIFSTKKVKDPPVLTLKPAVIPVIAKPKSLTPTRKTTR